MKTKTKRVARSAVVVATPAAPLQWKPDRAWHAEQRKHYALFNNLTRMQAPIEIAVSNIDDGRIFFARGSDGKDLFFLEEAKYQHPGERRLGIISRRTAFAITCLWAMPSCLHDYMLTVLKKGGAW